MPNDETVNVRYLVDDVAAAIDFYCNHFEFTVVIESRAFVERAVTFTTCPECAGTRLNEAARSSKIKKVSWIGWSTPGSR